MLSLEDVNLDGKRVMIRVDMNVPVENGRVADERRIRTSLLSIKTALEAGAKVIVVSHLGRPSENGFDEKYSLKPVCNVLARMMNIEIPLIDDYLDGIEWGDHTLVMCENIRFQKGEKSNDENLAKRLANLCDVFVMDAFGCAHRAHASTHGVAKYAKCACAGPLMISEMTQLEKALTVIKNENNEQRGLCVLVVGGAKVSGKIELLEFFIGKVDVIIPGGAIANTFLAAQGYPMGKSLYEEELIKFAKNYCDKAAQFNTHIVLPTDVVCADQLSDDAIATTKKPDQVTAGDMILDLGDETAQQITETINKANMVLWNGPLGAFEFSPFTKATYRLAQAIADSEAYCIAGGGDTLYAIDQFSLNNAISLTDIIEEKGGHVSTGGGSFIEFMQGESLPTIEILNRRAA